MRLPWLLVLFFGSGCAALIYEIVWFQLLQLVLGSSAVCLGVLLGTFMGGMCLGSLALSRLISARANPLRVYAFLELGIGALGVAALFVVPSIARIYVATVGHGMPGILLRGLVAAVCLLPPTLLMGATLPAMARWVEASPRGVAWLGFFYGGNIAGAVFGCLLAGFYLLRVYDMATATCVAAGINLVVAVLAMALARWSTRPISGEESAGPGPVFGPTVRLVYITIALSGMCAMGAEVIWTRLLSLMLGPSVYTFSIILAVFLVGMGIGSSVGSFIARSAARPRVALGVCQWLVALSIAWTAGMIALSLPYWPINPALTRSPWFTFQLDLVRCAWATLPATLLWGASFPLALAAVAKPGQDSGRLVGRVYAANTVGAIVGAVGASLVLVAWIGTQNSQRLLVVAAVISGCLMLVPSWWNARLDPDSPTVRISTDEILTRALASVVVLFATGLLVWTLPKVPGMLIAYGRFLMTRGTNEKILYVGEGMNASVAVTQIGDGVRNFHVSGKVEASTDTQDMRLQRMLGHIPAMLSRDPRSVLIVGCGAGVTAGSFVTYPGIQRIVICEIEPLIPQVVVTHFAKENYGVLRDPRVQVVYDDARHFILTTREKFDIITSDPIHPWVKGAATLYTKDYFDLVREHLNPGGLVTQWVPLYESNAAVVKSEIATFFEAFPGGTVWGNDREGEGYDTVLLGQATPGRINVNAAAERWRRETQAVQSIKDVGFRSLYSLLSTYAGRASDLQPWLKDAEINRDRNLRLQYLAGMASHLDQGGAIYDQMLKYLVFPETLFSASAEQRELLRMVIDPPKTKK